MRDDEVTVVDVAVRKIVSHISTGHDSEPDGMAWSANR
jgi:hypothetical protein